MLTTVERYRELPELPGFIQELRLGEVVNVPFPKSGIAKIQYRLADLLQPLARPSGVVAYQFPFRALSQFELRGAGVAFISHKRWRDTNDDDNLRGSPELVAEVLSPSSTQAEILKKAALCLATGCEEFWLVDSQRKTVIVIRQQGDESYKIGDRIPLARFHAHLDVEAIFAV